MKIGILTFQYCHNFGAMLQSYALKRTLQEMSMEVFFVDYKLSYLSRRYTFFPLCRYKGLRNKVRKSLSIFCHSSERYRTIKKFKEFEKSFFPLIKMKNVRQLDYVIVGSDQVWNPDITGGYDSVYYGGLISEGIPHLSYAASCPAKFINKDCLHLLKNFVAIGVREKTTQHKLDLLGVKSYMTIDPTLLLKAEDYNPIIENSVSIEGKYVFIYNLNGSSLLYDIAKKVRSSSDVKIVGNFFSKTHSVDFVYGDAGPKDFLALIKNSECAIVSSFHGTAFSIIFHKPFVYYPFGNEKDERSFTILEALGLDGCVFGENFDFDAIFRIEWDEVERRLELLRKSSIGFLTEYLKNNKFYAENN